MIFLQIEMNIQRWLLSCLLFVYVHAKIPHTIIIHAMACPYSHCGIANMENDSIFVYHAMGG